jgi:hypothetical protein
MQFDVICFLMLLLGWLAPDCLSPVSQQEGDALFVA